MSKLLLLFLYFWCKFFYNVLQTSHTFSNKYAICNWTFSRLLNMNINLFFYIKIPWWFLRFWEEQSCWFLHRGSRLLLIYSLIHLFIRLFILVSNANYKCLLLPLCLTQIALFPWYFAASKTYDQHL